LENVLPADVAAAAALVSEVALVLQWREEQLAVTSYERTSQVKIFLVELKRTSGGVKACVGTWET